MMMMTMMTIKFHMQAVFVVFLQLISLYLKYKYKTTYLYVIFCITIIIWKKCFAYRIGLTFVF